MNLFTVECLRPDCGVQLDMSLVSAGRVSSAGWLRLRGGPVEGVLCPVHAPAVRDVHLPSWADTGTPEEMRGIQCGCGWNWYPATQAGEQPAEWALHLMARDPEGRAA